MSSKSKLYFSNDNISSIFLTTALAMISNGVTGVIAVLIDGIIASQLLGEEEMAGNVVEHAIRKGNDSVCVNYRLFADRDSICFSIMDLGDRFDPAAANDHFNSFTIFSYRGSCTPYSSASFTTINIRPSISDDLPAAISLCSDVVIVGSSLSSMLRLV